jgi:hypothetical protein
MAEGIRDLLGKVSSPILEKIVSAQRRVDSAQAAPAESKGGKKVSAPLDVRPPAARNKPKPTHAKAKHSKFAKRAGHNPPKPEFAQTASLTTYDDPSAEARGKRAAGQRIRQQLQQDAPVQRGISPMEPSGGARKRAYTS